MQTLTKPFQSKIESFGAALADIKNGIERAGKLVVEMLEENESTFEILCGQYRVSLPFLEALERVGRGQLDPRLLQDGSDTAWRAISQALPIEQQRKLIDAAIPVAVRDNGGVRIENKRLPEITAREASIVIGDGKIRTADEQIELLKQKAATQAAKSLRYEIRGDRVRFHDGAEFDWSGLMEIANKIQPKAEDIEAQMKRNQI